MNDAPAFRSAYATRYSAYEAAVSASSTFWLQYAYPSQYSMDSFYIPVDLVQLGFGGAEVDSVLENMLNVIPQGDFQFASAYLS